MPNTPNINLDVRNFASGAPYKNVAASNGQTYSYCYTGGDDGNGGLDQTVGNGRDTALVSLIADQRYEISGHTFLNDPNNQLSWSGNSKRNGNIIDANNAIANAEYCVIVTDTGNGNCTIVCDPPIINR